MSRDLLQQILRYADWGWCVVPLHTPVGSGCSCRRPDCTDHGKHPRIRDWPTEATTDIDTIRRWWRQWPQANVGLATGTHLYVLDVDGDQGRQTLAQLEATHGALPETPRSLTGGGGEHYLFTLPDGMTLKNTVRFASGLDTRGPGGQIVAAPSLHASGRVYAWDAGAHPDEVPVAEMPAWLIQLIQQADQKAAATREATGATIPEGQRDSTLFRHACRLRQFGYQEAEILAVLEVMNQTRCVPPLDTAQVRAKVKQALGYEAGTFATANGHAPPPADPPRVQRITAAALLAKTLPPLVYVVEGLLPAGATLLTGKSKDGKSLMAYNLALAVASGGKAFGRFAVQQGAVWYLALEDGERRAQARIKAQMDKYTIPAVALQRLELTLWEAPRLTQGLEEELTQWMTDTDTPRLVIIDILEKVRPPRRRNGSIYEDDYQATQSITRLAQDHNVAVLIIHHANKLNPNDFRDSASGSMSLIGGADNFWSLNRQALNSDATLRITGRDILEEQELALEFKEGYWSVLGKAAEVNQSKERKEILDLLQHRKRSMTPAQIAEELQKNRATIRRLLRNMVEAGVLLQPYEGHYDLKTA